MSTWNSKMAMKLFPMIIGIPLYFSVRDTKFKEKKSLFFKVNLLLAFSVHYRHILTFNYTTVLSKSLF